MNQAEFLQTLQTMKIGDLQARARELGVGTSNKKEILIARILEVLPPVQQVDKPVERAAEKLVECTGDEVLEAVAKYTARGMKVVINDEDKTWHFRIQTQRGINEDSGTLKQPLSIIARKAEMVMTGRTLEFHRSGEFAGALA